MVLLHRLFEGFDRLVTRLSLEKELGRGAPDHDHTVERVGFLEVPDVFHEEAGVVVLRRGLFDVIAVQVLYVPLVEDGRPGLEGLQLGSDRVEVLAAQNPRLDSRFVSVVGEDVPAAEDEIVETGQLDEVLDQGILLFRPFPQADRSHLGQRADGLGEALSDGHDAGDEGRRHGAQADGHDPELSGRFLDIDFRAHDGFLP